MALKGMAPNVTPRDPAWGSGPVDLELVDLSAVDYVPAVIARGFYICTATGAIKLDTASGTTIIIPSGLAIGVKHDIAFTRIYKTGTAATGLVAFG